MHCPTAQTELAADRDILAISERLIGILDRYASGERHAGKEWMLDDHPYYWTVGGQKVSTDKWGLLDFIATLDPPGPGHFENADIAFHDFELDGDTCLVRLEYNTFCGGRALGYYHMKKIDSEWYIDYFDAHYIRKIR